MVRKNNPVPKVKPGMLFIFLLVSLILAGLVLFAVFQFRQQGINRFAKKMEAISSSFEAAEKTFTTSYNSIISKRLSVQPFILESLDTEYEHIQQELASLTETSQEKTRLEVTINQRRITVVGLSEMNTVIIAEAELGNALDNYSLCQKGINYTQKPALIVTALEKCEPYVSEAQTAVQTLPTIAYATCTLEQSPVFLVQQYRDALTLLKKEYALGAAEKTIEAAATEQEYRAKIAKIQSLPKWNSCISTYLQNKGTAISESR